MNFPSNHVARYKTGHPLSAEAGVPLQWQLNRRPRGGGPPKSTIEIIRLTNRDLSNELSVLITSRHIPLLRVFQPIIGRMINLEGNERFAFEETELPQTLCVITVLQQWYSNGHDRLVLQSMTEEFSHAGLHQLFIRYEKVGHQAHSILLRYIGNGVADELPVPIELGNLKVFFRLLAVPPGQRC